MGDFATRGVGTGIFEATVMTSTLLRWLRE